MFNRKKETKQELTDKELFRKGFLQLKREYLRDVRNLGHTRHSMSAGEYIAEHGKLATKHAKAVKDFKSFHRGDVVEIALLKGKVK